MRARGLALAVLASVLAGAALAQDELPSLADVPAGDATIRGRIVHPDRPEGVSGVEVVLYSLSREGHPGARRGTSDAAGRFVFADVSGEPGSVYLVGARHAGLSFLAERVAFAAGEKERTVEIRISEPTADASGLEVLESKLEIEWIGGRLAVRETHRLQNAGTRTFYVPRTERERGARAGFRTGLPEGAEGFRVPFGLVPEGLEQRGPEVAFFGPIHPGEQELAFVYFLPATKERVELRKQLLSAARRLVVEVPSDAPPVRAPALREGAEVERDGRSYRQLEADRVPAGTALALTVDLPAVRTAADALRPVETRIFLERDGAAVLAREEHRFEVSGDAPVVAPEGSALLRILLPPEARDLRFNTSAFSQGLMPTPDGGVQLLGPVAPGEASIEVVYRLPAVGGPVQLARRFDQPVPLLTVYVADTGIVAQSDRLHRRRPVRTSDRTYLHLEAFQVGAGETVALTLSSLAPRPAPSGALRIGLVVLAAAGAIALLTAPLRRGDRAEGPALDALEDAALDEREAVYEAIRDLDHDHETGKVAAADYEKLRQELRNRALVLLREARAAEAAAAPSRAHAAAGPPSAPRCTACGAEGQPGDRFCAACGVAHGTQPVRERGARA